MTEKKDKPNVEKVPTITPAPKKPDKKGDKKKPDKPKVPPKEKVIEIPDGVTLGQLLTAVERFMGTARIRGVVKGFNKVQGTAKMPIDEVSSLSKTARDNIDSIIDAGSSIAILLIPASIQERLGFKGKPIETGVKKVASEKKDDKKPVSKIKEDNPSPRERRSRLPRKKGLR